MIILFICRDTRNVTTYLGLCGHSGFLPEDVEVPRENSTLSYPVALLHDKDALYIIQHGCVTIFKSSDDSFIVSAQINSSLKPNPIPIVIPVNCGTEMISYSVKAVVIQSRMVSLLSGSEPSCG